MIVNPERYIQDFITAGADYITIHLEAFDDGRRMKQTLQMIKKQGIKAGLSIKPDTPAESVFPFLKDIDLILVMTVEPGFGNQKLIPACLEKVKKIRSYALEQKINVFLSVDGGVNDSTIELVRASGADIAVAGSAVFSAKSVEAAISKLKG